MFFDDDDERFLNPDLLHVVRREIFSLSNLDVAPYALRSAPTHTEDGIPIRKLYVSNLPLKATRSELFGVFAQYGFIKSCWLRMGEKGPNRTPTPTYAFVTYSNPADAHKALQAPNHEKALRGRNLRTSPADSWHQPAEDADGKVRWKPRGHRRGLSESNAPFVGEGEEATAEAISPECQEVPQPTCSEPEIPTVAEVSDSEAQAPYDLLDILNRDCLSHILSYVPIGDLIRSERVSKRWQAVIQDYLQGIRMFKTSWWQHVPVTLTTAVLRQVLARAGGSLQRLHIDHHWSALNDRTAHTVGKFCPNLEELKVVGMHTKNWNPLIYGCKQLKSLSFVSCNKLTDSSLVHLVKNESSIERLTVANNTHVTGLFLTSSNPHKLTSLAFYNCYSLQGTVLSAALDTMPRLTTLKLDVCPVTMWKIIPMILKKLPRLEELSLSEYTTVEICVTPQGIETFCEALSNLTELKVLNLSRNIYITNAVLKQVGQSCPKLESLNVSSCNSRKTFPYLVGVQTAPGGVGDEGLRAVWRGCPALRQLDVSYLRGLTDAGVAGAARLAALARVTARGVAALSGAALGALLAACPRLRALDVCGCDGVSDELLGAAARALAAHPRELHLYVAGTPAAQLPRPRDAPAHRLLHVDVRDDRSNPQLRPDFVDRVFEDSSDDSFDDMYDNDDMEEYFGPDDELFLDEELEEFDGMYAYGVRAPNIILL